MHYSCRLPGPCSGNKRSVVNHHLVSVATMLNHLLRKINTSGPHFLRVIRQRHDELNLIEERKLIKQNWLQDYLPNVIIFKIITSNLFENLNCNTQMLFNMQT